MSSRPDLPPQQGNQNPEIEIYRCAVKGSFDTHSWQTVEQGALQRNRWISQAVVIGDGRPTSWR